jgi:bifunctional non-homologous end joining protein LigD
MPLNWNQVKSGLDPQRFTMRTASALLKTSKSWEDYCDAERPLKQAIERLVKVRSGRLAAP